MTSRQVNLTYPIVTLDPEQWRRFTDKDRWDVMTALRGPDVRITWLKMFTTAPIRGAVMNILRTNGTSAVVISNPRLVIVPDMCPSLEGFDLAHFINHINDAAHLVGLKHVVLPFSVYQSIVRSPQPRVTTAQFRPYVTSLELEAIQEQYRDWWSEK